MTGGVACLPADLGNWWLVLAGFVLAFGAFAAVAIMLVDLGRDAMRWPE